MLSDFFEREFLSQFKYEPTPSQGIAMQKLSDFMMGQDENLVFLLKGYAGTGKTYLMASLIKMLKKLKQKSVLLAPTGRAAKVFSIYSGHTAFTIHKKIYRQQSSSDGLGRFVLDRNLHRDTLFIVDEASMIANQSFEGSIFGSGRLLDDLIEFVYASPHNCKLIIVGDTAQLPPVGLDISPALDKDELRNFYLNVQTLELTDVIRQEENSGILVNATHLRELIPEESSSTPSLKLRDKGFEDVIRMSGSELIEALEECYGNFGEEETVVLTRSNQRANRFNQGIRNSILYREEEISTGDMLMIVKNNYHWVDPESGVDFIANGDIAEIRRINGIEEQYGFRFADVTLSFADYNGLELDAKIILNTLQSESAALTQQQSQQLFTGVSDSYDIPQKRKRYKAVREDPYYNALQVKFAYAITGHKAQGGQWDAVFIDQGYFTEEMLNRDFLRWLYTAITRAKVRIYFVNFHDRFFAKEGISDS